MVQFESEEDLVATLDQVETEMTELMRHLPQFKQWAAAALWYSGKVRDAIARGSWPEAVFYALWLGVPKGIMERDFGIMAAEGRHRGMVQAAGRKKRGKRKRYDMPEERLAARIQSISGMKKRSYERNRATARLAADLGIATDKVRRLVRNHEAAEGRRRAPRGEGNVRLEEAQPRQPEVPGENADADDEAFLFFHGIMVGKHPK